MSKREREKAAENIRESGARAKRARGRAATGPEQPERRAGARQSEFEGPLASRPQPPRRGEGRAAAPRAAEPRWKTKGSSKEPPLPRPR